MMCCVGLIGGFAVGQALGGPWTVIAPAAGFGLGLVGDIKMMKGHAKQADAKPADGKAPEQGAAAAPAAQSGGAGCGIAAGVMRMFGAKEKSEKGQTLAEIRKTYQTGAGEPPAR